MNIRARIERRQIPSIAITAQVIQSIKLLQYGQEELQAFINEQAERNPLIDIEDAAGTLANGKRAQDPRDEPATRQNSPSSGRTGGGDIRHRTVSNRAGESDARSPGRVSLEDCYAVRPTLREHLHAQAALSFRNPSDRAVATQIIESIDDDGYFRREFYEIADALNIAEQRVEAVLETVQTFEPTGVGARDLAQCLALQLKEKGRFDTAMSVLIANLHLLAEFNIPKLARLCRVERDEILAMAKEIRDLDPRPGHQYDEEPTLSALPDILVRQQGDTFIAELNSALLPKVLVNREYYARVSRDCSGTIERRYVTDCIKNANWLVKNLDQRANTILKVATEIVVQQREFLLRGVEHLRPLNLRDVAEVIGLHESTVCRAISNKYMLTGKGIYELKYFFTNAIASSDSDTDYSAETVRYRIKQMIGSETSEDVLSDDAIVIELRRTGVDIARRTVAKYRETMNIPSSLQRRRQKMALQG